MKSVSKKLGSADEEPAPRLVEELIRQAEQAGASDVHLQMVGPSAEVAFRLDGVLTAVPQFQGIIGERVFGRIKFLARLKTYQELLPQDGRIDKAEVGSQNDIRVATYPAVTGEKIVLRLFNQSAVKSLGELEFPANITKPLERFLRQNSGLLLLTGPAGSGKTTTIYACLRYIAELGGRHIITIEDPVEQVIPGIMQTEVNEARGLSFAQAARHLLRQDPQALVIGEIRDEETAGMTVRAALTGHLVISTLHAGSCQGVLERLVAMCPDHHAAIAAVEFILNQRLIRRLCAACQGRGCAACFQTGYRGRAPIAELLRLDDALRAKIRQDGIETVRPERNLEVAAREILQRGWSDQKEFGRVLAYETG